LEEFLFDAKGQANGKAGTSPSACHAMPKVNKLNFIFGLAILGTCLRNSLSECQLIAYEMREREEELYTSAVSYQI
jgi:hypothetical protein